MSTSLPSAALQVTKILCRAFTFPGYPKGGNPLTVFLFRESAHDVNQILLSQNSKSNNRNKNLDVDKLPPIQSMQTSLAQSCDWESVMVYMNRTTTTATTNQHPASYYNHTHYYTTIASRLNRLNTVPEMIFYMPSGEEVSFCAHAAMGACVGITSEYPPSNTHITVHNHDENDSSSSSVPSSKISFTSNGGQIYHFATVKHNTMVELKMDAPLQETELYTQNKSDPLKPILHQILHEMGLSIVDVDDRTTSTTTNYIPPFLNSSVARAKTLLPIVNVERLHQATPPQHADVFRTLCDSIDSTGIYLYAPVVPATTTTNTSTVNTTTAKDGPYIGEFECRQFPRASGYPEDPATGIAAAALAASLNHRRDKSSNNETNASLQNEKGYLFHQGTAMGRRSQIQIRFSSQDEEDDDGEDNDTSLKTNEILYCSGWIDIDSRSAIMIE